MKYKITLILFILSILHQNLTAENLKVKWVYDGDTVLLSNNKKVRYIGINTPEIDHGDQKGEPFGYKSKSANRRMVSSQKILLKFDIEKSDRYGRTLAYVFLGNGTFINAELIRNGFAHCLVKKPNVKYKDLFIKLQRFAISNKKGIWKNFKNKLDRYIGNKNSFRFHRQNCINGRRVRKKNKVHFSTRKDPFLVGYSPCKKCKP